MKIVEQRSLGGEQKTNEEKAIDAAIEAALPDEGEFVSFDGDDNCEDCSGWDGVSRRCQCGNRRVAWAVQQFDGEYSAYPEVY